MMTLQEIINSIESLPKEEQDYLFEFLRQQRIKNRRVEILTNAQEVMQADKEGTAKRGSVDDLVADLLGDREESRGDNFWLGLQKFRSVIQSEGIIFNDEDFAGLRDRSVGREMVMYALTDTHG